MPARKFLYVVTALIVLTLGSAFAYRMWGQHMIAAVMVPKARFTSPPPLSAADYGKADLWFARPGTQDGPSLWLPNGMAQNAHRGEAAVFFVHPTSYMATFNSAKWNAPLDDKESQAMARRFVAGQSSAFSAAGTIWAPRYRQAHFGAFLRDSSNATKAIDAAYHDIEAAFAAFLVANPSGPIILAGHSQGSMHLMRLMTEKVAGTPVAGRIAAAYIIGWPVSLTSDLPALGLPACSGQDQAGCIISWQSFAEPADTSSVLEGYRRYPGMTGQPRKGTPMLCINPLTGKPDSAAGKDANLGTLAPGASDENGELVAHAVPARCGTGKDAGFLLIGDPPQMGPFTLPGNNYHVYDYALFWANIRQDASRRLTSFLKR
jgi:Protein of unknown function (DUF3089)